MVRCNVKILCAIICIILVVPILMGLTFNKEKNTIESLISKRSDIIGNVLSQAISIDKGKDMLKSIEIGEQYTKDIELLNEFINTDYEKIISTDIISLSKLNDVSDTLLYRGLINWTYSGYDGYYCEKGSYLIGLKNTSDGLKIMSFQLE